MAGRPEPGGNPPEMPEVVRQLASELLADSARLAEAMAAHLHAEIPELGEDEDLLAETRASCESNIVHSYSLMQAGLPADSMEVTREAREYARGLVSRGIKMPVLLRTYRLGHAWIWEQWSDRMIERVKDPEALTGAIDYSSRWIFTYIDIASATLVDDFAGEQARRLHGAEQLRAATVRAILAGAPLDEEVAARRIGHRLDAVHLALRISSTLDERRGLERARDEIAELLGAAGALTVAGEAGSIDAWLIPDRSDAAARLRAYAPPHGVAVAAGAVGEGAEGFRRTHDEAVQAARIAGLMQRGAGAESSAVTVYDDVELAALLTADEPRARQFVRRRLGALAAPDEASGRLRETVLAYLRNNRSSSRAAQQLFVHQNTVTYRVHKAEELLDRPVGEDPAELLCALVLAAVLGPDAPAPDGAQGSGRANQPS